MWNARKPYYDSLVLAAHGDALTEQPAARQSDITTVFPAYEKFWRYHVCPATRRPDGIDFRHGVADIISIIVQRNYTVFVYVVESRELLAKAMHGDAGPRNRDYYCSLMYAGNALQVLTELQNAICGRPTSGGLGTVRCLSAKLGVPLDPFPDWNDNWKAERESAANYRNYVTHQGWVYSVYHQASGKQLVCKRDDFQSREPWTWTHAARMYKANPSSWIEIGESCRGIVEDTVAFLDLAYERFLKVMEPLLPNPDYQQLWGWRDDQPTTATGNRSVRIAPSWMCGSTASPVDTRPKPPGSGQEIV